MPRIFRSEARAGSIAYFGASGLYQISLGAGLRRRRLCRLVSVWEEKLQWALCEKELGSFMLMLEPGHELGLFHT